MPVWKGIFRMSDYKKRIKRVLVTKEEIDAAVEKAGAEIAKIFGEE
jgi:hypoxanthine-guanine phosphoribosyltransferase